MKLKRLELRGFKTFAQSTEFFFPSGITGLVGPNGSGKSNIADAIRWVLGEQSMRAVRGKRSEDVIFVGAANRAPAGMAEVSITLDNTSGWLAVPYVELTITRRAYRSGDNEYLLNNTRIRLRDLNELLLKAGLAESTFVVIGQGMVDLALSLRAEERRALIDEAADVKRFQVKLHETRERLAATEQSLDRARDLLAEIEPRLKALADQSERFHRHQSLVEQLRAVQRLWHSRIRDELLAAHLAGEQNAARSAQELSDARQAADETVARRAALEGELAASRALVEDFQRRFERARQDVERHRRQSAVLAERRVAHEALRAELERDLKALRRAHDVLVEQRGVLVADGRALDDAVAAGERALAETEERYRGTQQEDRELAERFARARDLLQRWREKGAVLRDQSRALQERRHQVAAEKSRWQEVLASNEPRAGAVGTRIGRLEADLERLGAAQDAVMRDVARLTAEIAAGDEILQELAGQTRRLGRNLDERRARIEVLERWGESQVYSAGVRGVLRAAVSRKGKPAQLTGVIGVVADLLRSPQELETAIEVALGGRAQDVVVERWADAEAAIALLKSNAAGRATFLPLDTLRPPARLNPFHADLPGMRGVAAELVACEPRYAGVVQHLLGRTAVVDGLAIARHVLAKCPPGWQIVTVEGEIVRASGAVTGGSRKPMEAGLLSRQRELRELRQSAAALESETAAIAARLATERAAQGTRRQGLGDLERRRREAETKLRQAENALAEARAEQRSLLDEQRWVASALAREAREEERVAASLVKTDNDLALAEKEAIAAAAQLSSLEEQQSVRAGEQRQGNEELAGRRMALAVRQSERDGLRQVLQTRDSELAEAVRRVEERQRRLASLSGDEAALAVEASAVACQLEQASCELDRLQAQLDPARAATVALRRGLSDLDAKILECRERVAELAGREREAGLELRRVSEQITQAQQQAASDLGPAVAAEVWSANEEVDAAPVEALKREVDALRSALRAVGPVNPQVIEEYEETSRRYEFLSRQVADMEEATRSLQRLTAELQRNVRERFEHAFFAVGKEFRRYFTQLFGGGAARLTLSEPDDPSQSGIEIVAQPPGRRLQNLSLLSGGERALTAVALLFAVLAVRPMPFCVLDEVDAALDEANVGRFCEALRGLAQNTQFVIITHNRGTMETADSLYGISMPADSSTQVVSLRLSSGSNGEETGYVQSAQPTAPSRR